jgi:hypothetical protein
MISRSEMIPLLVEACPSFESEWRQFQTECADEPDLPNYLAIGDFAKHLSRVLAEGNEVVLRRVFDVIERLILDGDAYVAEAAVVGVIEDLQNTNLHTGTTPEQYLPFLLPQTRRWWTKVNAFWSKGELLTDD